MRVLALEPYYGGSHRAFLDGWIARSLHEWTVLSLPAHKWKWRMRHSPLTFADELSDRCAAGERWDAIFCSDMLPLAELLGLGPAEMRLCPTVAYFHENQLTYPARHADPRDLHFAFSNLMTALAATQVWFNSSYHRETFLAALGSLLTSMPDHADSEPVERIREKSLVAGLGIDAFPPRRARERGALRILWAARWEHDKDPDTFFQALDQARAQGVEFRVSVIGEQFRTVPDVFAAARKSLADRIDRWGYQESREDYRAALLEADVIVSTAKHEFFGLSVAEAIAAGAYPMLPKRLAYPELLALEESPEREEFFYDGSPGALASRLGALAKRLDHGSVWGDRPTRAAEVISRYHWERIAPQLDQRLEALITAKR
jgi:glycosyltransferase involved in cell wall biosynthesis